MKGLLEMMRIMRPNWPGLSLTPLRGPTFQVPIGRNVILCGPDIRVPGNYVRVPFLHRPGTHLEITLNPNRERLVGLFRFRNFQPDSSLGLSGPSDAVLSVRSPEIDLWSGIHTLYCDGKRILDIHVSQPVEGGMFPALVSETHRLAATEEAMNAVEAKLSKPWMLKVIETQLAPFSDYRKEASVPGSALSYNKERLSYLTKADVEWYGEKQVAYCISFNRQTGKVFLERNAKHLLFTHPVLSAYMEKEFFVLRVMVTEAGEIQVRRDTFNHIPEPIKSSTAGIFTIVR